MFRGAKALPESATADWHGDENEQPKYLKIVSAMASKNHLGKRASQAALVCLGYLLAVATMSWFPLQIAISALLGLVSIIYSVRWIKQFSTLLQLQKEADQGIKIVDRGPETEEVPEKE